MAPRDGQKARTITAAAKRLPVRGEAGASFPARAEGKWQDEAWSYFDSVPEVKFAARFLGNSLSRLRLYPAVIVEQDAPPVAVSDAAAMPGSGISAELAAAAEEEWARLDRGEGLAAAQREFGVCLTISGDANLVGAEDETGEETWAVYSEAALTKGSDGTLALKETPNATAVALPEDAFVARIWRRHSRWPGLADSNMLSILDVCEELLIYSRQFRAVGRSRTSAGILLLPNGLDFAAQKVTVDDPDGTGPLEDEEDEDDLTPMERSIVDSLVTPTADDGSASQVVPNLLRGSREDLKEVRLVTLDRKIDEAAIARIVHLISRCANGLDVPVEVLTGVADANHWTAWQIEDATYKAHVEPLAQIPAQGLRSVFLLPALIARGFTVEEVRRVVIAIDPSALVVRPNRGADARDAFDRDALSWDALRQYLGFSDADAPSSDELLLRYTLDRSIGGMSLTRDLFQAIGQPYDEIPSAEESAIESADAERGSGANGNGNGSGPPVPSTPPEDGGTPTPATEPQATVRRALATVIAASASASAIGDRLAAIDARLRERVQIAASDALNAALGRAGKRLRAAAQGDPNLSGLLRGQPNEAVGEILGQAGAEDLPPASELLSDSDFAQLGDQFSTWVTAARTEALAAARRAVPTETDTFDDLASEVTATADDDNHAGWLILLGALLTLGRSRIYTPDGSPDDGEFDAHVAVPPGPVREALARAGGALGEGGAPSATGLGAATGGPASGTKMIRLLQRAGAVTVGWRWDVGLPARPFRPHQALAGVTFRAWDDPELASGGGFPGYGHYFPGDHKGCQCDAVPILVFDETGTGGAPRGRIRTRA